MLLRHALNARIGHTGLRASFVTRLWASAILAAVVGVVVKYILGIEHAILLAVVALGAYGAVYLGLTSALGVGDGAALVRRAMGRFGGARR
jgi:hypothetical protein